MGTKKNPGKFDCYKEAADDEPLFIIRGSDSTAGALIVLWRALKKQLREDGKSTISNDRLEEALALRDEMDAYARSRGKSMVDVRDAMIKVFSRMRRFGDTVAIMPTEAELDSSHKMCDSTVG